MSRSRLVLAVVTLILLAFGAVLWLSGDRGGTPPQATVEQTAEGSSCASTKEARRSTPSPRS